MSRYTQSRARRSMMYTAAYRAVSQLATIVGYVIMVRWMTESDFGIFSLLYSVIPLVMSFASFGLEQTLIRYQPEYLRAGKLAAADWLIRLALRARLATNLALLTLMYLGWGWFAPLFHLSPYRAEFALFGVIVLLHFQTQMLQFSLASHMLHDFSVGMVALLAAAKLIAYLLVIALWRLTLTNAILADTAAYVLTYIGLKYLHERHCRLERAAAPFRPAAGERRRLLRYAALNNFNEVGSFVISSQSDNFFIAAMVNPIAVGAYSFYTRLTQMAARVLPLRLFDNVVQPLFFAAQPEDAPTRMPRYFTFLLNSSLVLLLPMVVYSTAYHREIVGVFFAGKFIADSLLLPVVFAFLAVNIIATPVTLVAQYEEKAGVILASKLFVVYSIGAMLLLLPRMGLLGAAIATGTGELFKNLFIWWHVRRSARWLNFRAMLTMIVLVWGGALLLCLAVKSLLPGPAWMQLAVGAMVCAASGLVFLRTPALADSDRALAASLLHGREAVLLRKLGVVSR